MKLSLFSDYSLRTLIFAALKDDWFQIEEVTAAYGISQHHLAKVVQHLAKSGHLQTRRGRGGGIRLAGDPSNINLGTLLRQSEGPSPLLECFDRQNNTCPLINCCAAKGYFGQALEAFFQVLDKRCLQDLISNTQRPRMMQALKLGHTTTPAAETATAKTVALSETSRSKPKSPKTYPLAGSPTPPAPKAQHLKQAPAKARPKPSNALSSKPKAKARARNGSKTDTGSKTRK